jgi:Protein of unknown function (DUF3761)
MKISMDPFKLVLPWLLVAALSLPVFAKESPDKPYTKPNESQLVEHGSYVNKAGNTVHSPAHTKDGSIPQGASAKCSDGTFSFSQSRRGTCSRHGGVSQWL